MAGGGAERVTLTVARFLLKQGWEIDLVLRNLKGLLLEDIDDAINLHVVDQRRPLDERNCKFLADQRVQWHYEPKRINVRDYLRVILPYWPLGITVLPRRKNRYVMCSNSLAKYFVQRRPDVVMTMSPHDYFCTLLGLRISRTASPIICSVHNTVRDDIYDSYKSRDKVIFFRLLKYADWTHTVSEGIKQDIVGHGIYPENRISTIYNPAIEPEHANLSHQTSNHPWIDRKVEFKHKVILAVGDLANRKGHRELICAFAKIRATVNTKLIILGEGPERKNLEYLICQLGLSDYVALPGWLKNPFPFMRGCDVFALSSRYEGLANVLIEALYCGCKIVAKDCPHGPSEVLENGRYGTLVPMDDENALVDAILCAFKMKVDRNALKKRAEDFTIERIGPQYEKLLGKVVFTKASTDVNA